MTAIDPARWAQLLPLLDEWLDLPAEEREQRLAALAQDDPALAAELATLLARDQALESQGFLAAGALPAPEPLAGRTLGPYTLERELGRGGMGQVWLARRTDGRYDGTVAIKLLQGGLFGQGDPERFAREGRILARLDQVHIARLLDAGVSEPGAQPYLVLEHVDGVPIDQYVQEQALPLRACLQLMVDAAEAVAHAHARLILHRDLKPSNMLVRPDGTLKLLDFGIAKLMDESGAARPDELTQGQTAAYTPAYAAPEQLQGQDVTTATDVYALGVLLYQLLGGGHPTAVDGATPLDRLRSAIETEPPRLSDRVLQRGGADAARRSRELRGDVDTLVARALKKKPAERYANAADLADDLRRLLAHEPLAARPDRWDYRAAKFVRRNRLPVAAGAVALLAVLTGATLAVLEARESRAQRLQAEGLIEFMLGDLRKKLEPVGRLDALDAVGERALAYYQAQDAAGLDAESLGRRARALHLIGEIAEQRGQLEEAGRRFDQAARSTAERLARSPDDVQRLFDHAQSEFWLGFVAWRRGQAVQAEAAFERYRSLALRLVALAPERIDWQIEPAFAEQNLGVVRFDKGRLDDALLAFNAARRGFDALRGRHPEATANLADNLGWIARVRVRQARYEDAIDAQRAKIEALTALPGAADDRRTDFLVAVARHEIGRLMLWRAQAVAAEPVARQAVAALERLNARDSSNLDWTAQLGTFQIGLADILRAQGRLDEARQTLAQARQVLDPLWPHAAGKTRWNLQLRARWLTAAGGGWLAGMGTGAGAGAGADAGLAADAGAVARPAAARSELGDLLAHRAALNQALQAQQAAGNALREDERQAVAEACLVMGDVQQRRGRPDEARTLWLEVLSHLDAADADPAAWATRGQAEFRLGRTQVAAAMAERLQETPYRHPQVLDLFRRLGVSNP
jgi:eukaryotic-like serine/threonine-protein kinase